MVAFNGQKNEHIVKTVHSRFMCRTPHGTGPAPHKVSIAIYGSHASYVENGYRWWGFASEIGRDNFVSDFDAEAGTWPAS
jgi:hypothetical protein